MENPIAYDNITYRKHKNYIPRNQLRQPPFRSQDYVEQENNNFTYQ